MNKLKITNYDNFKDASVFIREYFEAEKRMKEISDFFQSFYMSKLIRSEDICKTNPSFISLGDYDVYDSWTYSIVDHEVYLGFNSMSDYDRMKKKGKSVDKEHTDNLKSKISMMLRGDYACYFVFDKDNILYEFVPVEAKDTIRVTFDETSIKITGHYYTGYQHRGDFNQPEEYITKIVRVIRIDPSNNNVIDVKTYSEDHKTIKLSSRHVDLGYRETKKHAWSESQTVDTFNYVNPYKVMRDYIEDNYANYQNGYYRVIFHTCGSRSNQGPCYIAKDKKELDSIYKNIIRKHKGIFKEVFAKDLTKSELDRYRPLLWLRDDVINECYKKHPDEFEVYEEDGIPKEDFPLVKWYRCTTKKFILEENE